MKLSLEKAALISVGQPPYERRAVQWTETAYHLTLTINNGHIDRKENTMKKMVTTLTLAMCGFVNMKADDVKQPYIIQRADEVVVVKNMPTFTVSEPISNSFVYINGEYINSLYIVSITNLAVCINGHVIRDYEPGVHTIEYYKSMPGRRIGGTPDNVGRTMDYHCNSL